MTAGTQVWKESDGKSVEVSLSYTTLSDSVAYVNGWLGITSRGGASGDSVVLQIDRTEYQIEVPASLSVSKGQIVRIDLTQLGSAHTPPDAAFNTSAESATNINLMKATAAKDSANVVTGILLAGL